MLIEFSVANFRSLYERQTLSLVKAKGVELVDSNTFKAVAAHEFELLRSAAIAASHGERTRGLVVPGRRR